MQIFKNIVLTYSHIYCIILFVANGWVPEWLKGADCKSAAFRFVGSNPTLTTNPLSRGGAVGSSSGS